MQFERYYSTAGDVADSGSASGLAVITVSSVDCGEIPATLPGQVTICTLLDNISCSPRQIMVQAAAVSVNCAVFN